MQHYGYGRTVEEAVRDVLRPAPACKSDACSQLARQWDRLVNEQGHNADRLRDLERHLRAAERSANVNDARKIRSAIEAVLFAFAALTGGGLIAAVTLRLIVVAINAALSALSGIDSANSHITAMEDRRLAADLAAEIRQIARRLHSTRQKLEQLEREWRRDGCEGRISGV